MSAQQGPKIVVLGRMCFNPFGGVVWQALHYMLGLRQLGFDPYYVEGHGKWVADPVNASTNPEMPRVMIGEVMQRFGFADHWMCRADYIEKGYSFGGMSQKKLASVCADAEAILNLTATNVIDAEQYECPRRIYLETDPGVPQIRLTENDPKIWNLVSSHTHHFTFAENLGNADCGLPKPSNLKYYPTRQPVVLDLWATPFDLSCQNFTTIAKWGGRPCRQDIEFHGDVYPWRKDLEFRKFLDLPGRSRQPIELALSKLSRQDETTLKEHGWRVACALSLSASIDDYQRYIQRSRGEFTVAKDQNVRLRSGWFSDRSACYLAAGKPVITQDTGFGNVLPTGEGLFAFQTMDDILSAFDAIDSNYERHCRAARDIAREYFDATKVLRDLLHKVGLEPPVEERCVFTKADIS